MKKMFILILPIICMSCWVQAEEEPFSLNLSYSYENQKLGIDMERLSRDETLHFMYRLEILKNDLLNMEEDLTHKNHLNKIKMKVPCYAQAEDKITVRIIYGDEKVFVRSIVVEGAKNTAHSKTTSILIGDDDIKDIEKIKPRSISKEKEPPLREFGYSVEKEEEYGYKDLGYEQEQKSEPYGYELKDSETYSRKTIDPDEESAEPYGYEDEGAVNVDQGGFGYSDSGYEGDPTPFGRENYKKE